jgi:hypothetical protein
VIAAIGSWLTSTGQLNSIDKIKAIACRATGYTNFNKIPIERLRNLYYGFKNKSIDMANIDELAKNELTKFSNLN